MHWSLTPDDPEDRAEAEGYLKNLYGLMALFLLAIVELLPIANPDEDVSPYLIIVAPLIPIAIAGYLNARREYRWLSSSAQALVMIAGTVAAVTMAVHVAGGAMLLVASVYPLLVIVATAYFRPRAGVIALGLALGAFGAYLALESTVSAESVTSPWGSPLGSFFFIAVLSMLAYGLAYYLSQSLHDRRKIIQDANSRLVALDETKNRFLGVVSHDLRTPITAIRAFAELIADDAGKLPPEKEKEFADTIVTEADRLNRLVTDLLDLDKMAAGQMEWRLTRQSVVPVLDNARRIFQGAAEDKDIALNYSVADDLPEFPLDADRFAQLMANLLSNAIKFTPAGGTVTLNAHATAADTVVISVTDTGPGIAPEDRDRIFDRYSQTETARDATAGTGLGLAIVKEIITAHGGTVAVDSPPGGGTAFILTIPGRP